MTAADAEPLALPASTVPDPATAPALRWAVIGPGGIARHFSRTLHAATASRVVAAASRSRDRAKAFAADVLGPDAASSSISPFDSIPAMLEAGGVDAVYVASPHAQHAEHALAAIEAGFPVLVEKAFARNAAEARQVLDAARARGVLAMEAMWTRFLPQSDVLRQVVSAGMLGELVLVRADHGQHFDVDDSHRLRAPELAGGALLDLGVYPLSFAQMLLGDLSDLAATGSLTSTGVDADAIVLARGASGAHAILDSTQRTRTATTAEVAGTHGTARLSGPFYAPGSLTVSLHDGRTATFEHPGHRDRGMAYEAAEFARRFTAGETESPLMPWSDTLSVMEAMDEVRAQLGVVFPGEKGNAR